MTGFYMMVTLAFNELRSGDMPVMFINECKSCEISNQMFFNVVFSFSKAADNHKYTREHFRKSNLNATSP